MIDTSKPKPDDKEEALLQSNKVHDRPPNLEIPLGSDVTSKNIRASNKRWVILMLGIMTTYGAYFCNDNPQPLQNAIEEKFQIEDAKFNLLYSMSILPNVIIPFIGGMTIDALGTRFTMIMTIFLVVIGQAVVTMGAAAYDFNMMLLGRFIYGCGNQTLENTLLVIVAKWFLARELTFAWGLARTFLRSATALNSFLVPKIYDWSNRLYVPFLIGVFINTVSFFCVFAVVYIDSKVDAEMQDQVRPEASERLSLKKLKSFPKLYYLLVLIGVGTYTSFLGFTNNANKFLVTRFGFTPESAGSAIMLIYIVSGVLSPFVGILIDKLGRRIIYLFTAVLIIFLTQLFFLLLEDSHDGDPNYLVIYGFVGFGLFYALFSTTYWTSIPVLVNTQSSGTALGLVTCSSAISQSIFTEALGIIHDNSLGSHHGYFWTQVAHCIVISIVLCLVVWAYFEDTVTGGRLHKPKRLREEDRDEKGNLSPIII